MAVTTKKTFPAANGSTASFSPIGIELNNHDDLDVYVTLAGTTTRILQLRQATASTVQSSHPQVNDTTGLYFPPVAVGTSLTNYTISANNNTIVFNANLASGAIVSCERRTRDESGDYTSFSGGSTIRSSDLNTAFDEVKFTAQEARNKAFDIERKTFSEDDNLRILEDQTLIFEGATDDGYETTVTVTDPTADRTVTIPNHTGNVVLTGLADQITATELAANSVDSSELVDGSIDTSHIANLQVTTAKLGNDAVTNAKIADDQIDSEHYVAASIDTEHIADSQITTAKIAANAVTAAELGTNSVVTTKITDGHVTTPKLADDAVTGAKIADDQIDSNHYVDGSIDTAHIANAQVTTAKIAADAITNALIADFAVDTENIHGDAITTAKIEAGAVQSAQIADNAVDSDHYVDGSIDTAHLANLQVTTAKIANDAITNAKIADDQIDSEHYVDGSIDLAHMSANSVDSDQYVDGSVDRVHLAADIVDGTKIADDSINSEHYVDGSIDTAHIANSQVTTAKLGDNAVTTAKITDLNVTTAKIAADAINASKIADDVINSEHIAADSLDTEHYAAGSVDTTALASDSVTTVKITNANVTTNKIADNAVTTAKIADGELKTLAGSASGTASIIGDSSKTLTANIDELNLLDGKSIITSISGSATDVQLPTAQAVNERIVTVMQDSGGFVPIANEVSFPNTNPDPNDDAGTIVSIADAGGVVVNGSGVSTTGRTLGGTTVTINGIDSSLHSTTIAAGKGMLVETTSTLNTYTYHRLVVDEAGVATAQSLVSDFNQRYRVASSAPNSSLDDGDLYFDTTNNKMKVYNSTTSSWDDVATPGNFFINTIASSSGTGGGSSTFNGSAYRFQLSNAPALGAPQLLVSINGVIQKPNSGTSQPSDGFACDGNDIIFSSAPASNSPFFIVTIGSAVTIGTPSNNTVTTAILQSGCVTTAKIADDAITAAKIADGAIDAARIATNAVTAAELADNAVDSAAIAANAVVGSKIASDAVTGAKISNASVTTAKIADSNVTTAKINDGAVTNAKLGSDCINGSKIADNAIDSEHYTDGSIDTAHIAADQITGALIADDAVGAEHIEQLDADLSFADSAKAKFGTGNDLEIFHDGSHSYIKDTSGTGNLYLDTNNLIIRNAAGNETALVTEENGAIKLYYDNSSRLFTSADGGNLYGNWTLGDNGILKIGNNADLKIYHNGSQSLIDDAGTGALVIRSDNAIDIKSSDDEMMAAFNKDGAVNLYYNNSRKCETTNSGLRVYGNLDLEDDEKIRLGDGDDFQLYHDGSHNILLGVNGADFKIKDASHNSAIFDTSAGVYLYYDNIERFRTTSAGTTISGTCTATAFAGDGSNLSGIEAFVTGMILLWSGAENAIPSGFVLCNGSNSTPDLRDRFVVGAGSTYGVGGTGGSANVTLSANQIAAHGHSFSANTGNQSANHYHDSGSYNTNNTGGHSHSGNTNNTGAHSHTWDRQDAQNDNGYRPWPASNNDCGRTTANTSNNGNHSHNISTNNTGNHSHSLGGNSGGNSANHTHSVSGNTGNSGNTAAHENRPPYYALCYIMKT